VCVCVARKKLIHSSRLERSNFVLFKLDEFCRRGDEFRGLADDHLSRTSPARFRVPSASQVSAFTLRSPAEISRVRARAHARGFLWERAIAPNHVLDRLRDHRTPPSNRSAAIDIPRRHAPRRDNSIDFSRYLATRLSHVYSNTDLEHFES